MTPTHFKLKSLSGTIFRTVLVFTVVVVLAFSAVEAVLFYVGHEREAEAELIDRAVSAAAYLDESTSDDDVEMLSEQFGGFTRYTLVADDGTVLYDSMADESSIENHANRPEIMAAEEAGQATSARYSETLQTDTLYAAVRLDDGSVIRLAEDRRSLLAFIASTLAPMLVALAVVVVLVFVLSRLLTRRIMKPIDALDFANPLENEIYEEMDPLLERIDEQQRQLVRQTGDLARAESMRRDFSANVSHEMKTPLQVISGYAELMKNDMVNPEDRQKFSALIYEEAQAMRSLINDVLTLSRLDESAIGDDGQLIDLLASAKSVRGRLASFAEKAGVEIVIKGERAVIAGSDTLAEEMLYNLIENGIRYNHEGGTVTMTVGNDENGPVVTVVDTGQGIPAEMHDKVFERFFRVDKSRSKETGGTGLGLAIVKHAVMYHGGTIELQSELGHGTTFILHFPRPEDR